MKKILLSCTLSVIAATTFATIAPDFTATDCNGTSHNLYTELAQGKVIVLNWVMPCAACVNASVSAYNIVQAQTSSNVLYYLMDDDALTSCTSLSTWATNSGIGSNRVTFSTSSIVESNYGGVGMPHVTVVGPNGLVYFNGLNGAAYNVTAVQSAIASALLATGIHSPELPASTLKIFPNPANQLTSIGFNLETSTTVKIELVNIIGKKVSEIFSGNLQQGENKINYDCSKFNAGIYFVKLSAGDKTRVVKLVVTH